uniref:TIGR00366 family protein n=1 Tax=Bosea sp. NBC_00436 TaxID=2969620 RepID=A0A9E7ZRQ5_9HYPH
MADISREDSGGTGKGWSFPDPMVLIFGVLVAASLLAVIIPKGTFERITEGGRQRVVPGSFTFLESQAGSFSIGGFINGLFSIFVAIPRGMLAAAPYLFIVFIAGGLFHVMSKSDALENSIGTIVKKVGRERRGLVIWLTTYLYGVFGIAVGFENNIALIPVALIIAAAIGYSNVVGVCMAVGGIGVGFALSPINPYTVGTSQGIAQLPLFSGALYRTIMCFGLLTLLAAYISLYVAKRADAHADPNDASSAQLSKDINDYYMSGRDTLIIAIFAAGVVLIALCSYLAGTGQLGRSWFINEIAAVFLIISILTAVVCRMKPAQYVEYMIEGASMVTGGALIIGLAASISVVLQDGGVIDTIVNGLNQLVANVPTQFVAVATSVIQGVINFFIPSGSAQALITMPILVPLADLMGMSRQLMILAFQVGDGLSNLIIPTVGGMLAMLALGRVSYGQWLKVILPFILFAYVLCWIFLIVGYYIGY